MNGVGDYYLLTVRYGNSRHFTVAVNNEDGTPKDMSSENVQMVIYDDSGRITTLTSSAGLTITLGEIAVDIPASVTTALKQRQQPKYEIEFVTTDNNSPCILYGEIKGIGGNG